MTAFDRLGAEIAREQDALRGRARHRAQVRAYLAALELTPAQSHRRSLIAATLAAAAALSVAAAFVLWPRPSSQPRALTLEVGPSSKPVLAGAWIEADQLAPTQLRFSDGTRVEMAPSARARVVEIDAAGAHLLIESGQAHVAVVPRGRASWRLSVGPFVVRVKGTRFDVRWDPERDAFELDLEHGRVEVAGCVFGSGFRMTGGQAVQASCKRGHLHVGQRGQAARELTDRGPAAMGGAPAPEVAAEIVAASAPKQRPAGERRSRSRAAPPGWRALAVQGKYAAAYAAAEASGFEAECARADAQELAMLADAARHARRPEHEGHALQTLRRRFAGSPRAALAAFALGRLEFDRHQSYREAAEWFGTYLKEQPRGPLTREARGRVMEAVMRAGDAERARELARSYLTDYPSGPHAELARGLRAAP
jgi:hypothetical protein